MEMGLEMGRTRVLEKRIPREIKVGVQIHWGLGCFLKVRNEFHPFS